jgi:DNA polymerase III epsilon subunit-like protein
LARRHRRAPLPGPAACERSDLSEADRLNHVYRRDCPHLAMTNLLDTVRLAYPDLPSHRLDVLIHHLRLWRPPDRHRAMPDVEITAEVFAQVLHDGHRNGHWVILRDLRRRDEYQAKATRPEQTSLF